MKTAVEILEEQLYEWLDGRIYLPPAFFEQAKQMEKEQIESAYETAMETDIYNEPLKIGKDYFNQTFKSER
jgi:hypothetical protein